MKTCPNCIKPLDAEHFADVCALGFIAGILQDRGVSDDEIEKCLQKVDVTMLWDDLGEVVDKVHDGEYQT